MTELSSRPPGSYPYDVVAGLTHLTHSDPRFAAHVATIGEYRLPLRQNYNSFQALLRAMVYQQVSSAAAATVFSRVCALTSGARLPGARALARIDDKQLRECGLSGQKLSYIRALIDAAQQRQLPSIRQMLSMTDAKVLDALIQIRGVGLWTVQMVLIFHLARPDVMPVGDLAIRKGFSLIYAGGNEIQHHGADIPTMQELQHFAERWHPYRTIASWYLWRAAVPDPRYVP